MQLKEEEKQLIVRAEDKMNRHITGTVKNVVTHHASFDWGTPACCLKPCTGQRSDDESGVSAHFNHLRAI